MGSGRAGLGLRGSRGVPRSLFLADGSSVDVAGGARVGGVQERHQLVSCDPTILDEGESLAEAVVESVVAQLAEPHEGPLCRVEVLRRELDGDGRDGAAETMQNL